MIELAISLVAMLDRRTITGHAAESPGIDIAVMGLMPLSFAPSRYIDFAIALALGYWCL
jgi:hypothetical protein